MQKLGYMEHAMSIENNGANPIRRIELGSKHYTQLSPQLDGKYSKSMSTFWATLVCEQWEDSCDVRVVRMNGVEEYDENTINNTKWANGYEDIKIKVLVPSGMSERIGRENASYNERLLNEIDRLTYKWATK